MGRTEEILMEGSREENGVKFQTVVYRAENADYEGIISLENKLLNVDYNMFGDFSLVYWLTGAVAGCAVQIDGFCGWL